MEETESLPPLRLLPAFTSAHTEIGCMGIRSSDTAARLFRVHTGFHAPRIRSSAGTTPDPGASCKRVDFAGCHPPGGNGAPASAGLGAFTDFCQVRHRLLITLVSYDLQGDKRQNLLKVVIAKRNARRTAGRLNRISHLLIAQRITTREYIGSRNNPETSWNE